MCRFYLNQFWTIQLSPYLLSLIPITNPISNPKIPLQLNIQTELQNQYKAKALQFQQPNKEEKPKAKFCLQNQTEPQILSPHVTNPTREGPLLFLSFLFLHPHTELPAERALHKISMSKVIYPFKSQIQSLIHHKSQRITKSKKKNSKTNSGLFLHCIKLHCSPPCRQQQAAPFPAPSLPLRAATASSAPCIPLLLWQQHHHLLLHLI